MPERPDMEGPWYGGSEWSSCHLGEAVKPRFDHIAERTMPIYFLRKKGTSDQYYQRQGGLEWERRGCRKWGPKATAACWTTLSGPRPLKDSGGEIVFSLLEKQEKETF